MKNKFSIASITAGLLLASVLGPLYSAQAFTTGPIGGNGSGKSVTVPILGKIGGQLQDSELLICLISNVSDSSASYIPAAIEFAQNYINNLLLLSAPPKVGAKNATLALSFLPSVMGSDVQRIPWVTLQITSFTLKVKAWFFVIKSVLSAIPFPVIVPIPIGHYYEIDKTRLSRGLWDIQDKNRNITKVYNIYFYSSIKRHYQTDDRLPHVAVLGDYIPGVDQLFNGDKSKCENHSYLPKADGVIYQMGTGCRPLDVKMCLAQDKAFSLPGSFKDNETSSDGVPDIFKNADNGAVPPFDPSQFPSICNQSPPPGTASGSCLPIN